MTRDDLTAYIAAVRHITAEWELDECAEFEPDPTTLKEIQKCILRLLKGGVEIYLKPSEAGKKVDELISLCQRCLKPKIGSSVRLSEVLGKWICECRLEEPVTLIRTEQRLYGEIAAVAVDLTCDVHQEDGIWMIGNAEWKSDKSVRSKNYGEQKQKIP